MSILRQLAKLAVPAAASAARSFVRGNTMNKLAEKGINALEGLLMGTGNADSSPVTADWVRDMVRHKPALDAIMVAYGVEGGADYVAAPDTLASMSRGSARAMLARAITLLRDAKVRTTDMAFEVDGDGQTQVATQIADASAMNPALLRELLAPNKAFPSSMTVEEIGLATTRGKAWRASIQTTLQAMLKVPKFEDLGGRGARTTSAVVRSYAMGKKLGDASPPAAGIIATLTPDGVYVGDVGSAERLTAQKDLERCWDILGAFKPGRVSCSMSGTLAPTKIHGPVEVELAGPVPFTADHPTIATAFKGTLTLAERVEAAGEAALRNSAFGAGSLLVVPDIGPVTQSGSTMLTHGGALGIAFTISKEMGVPPPGDISREVVKNPTPPPIGVYVVGFVVRGIRQHLLGESLASASSAISPVMRTVRYVTAVHEGTTPGLQYSVNPLDNDINGLLNQEVTAYSATADVNLAVPATDSVFYVVMLDPRMTRGDGTEGVIATATAGFPGNEIPSFSGPSGIAFTPKVVHTTQTPSDLVAGLRQTAGGVRALRMSTVQGLTPEASGPLAYMKVTEQVEDPDIENAKLNVAQWANMTKRLADLDSTTMQLDGVAFDTGERSWTAPIGVGTAANYVRAISRNAEAWNRFAYKYDEKFHLGLPSTFAEFVLWVPPKEHNKASIVQQMIEWNMVVPWYAATA